MVKYIIKTACFLGTVFLGIVSVLSLGLHDYASSITGIIIFYLLLLLTLGKKISWAHKCFNYSYFLILVILDCFKKGGFNIFFDGLSFIILCNGWSIHYQERKKQKNQENQEKKQNLF